MRILLVESGVTAPERFVYQCYPPHGLMYLASYLRSRRPGHELRLFDMMEKRARASAIDEILEDFKPNLVAIHAMSFQASCMHALAARIKSWDRKVPVAVGGPHPSAAPRWTLSDANVDVAAMGEGELTFVDLVDRAVDQKGFEGVPGTAVMKEGELILGPPREYVSDLDEIPFPAWDLIEPRRYFTDVMLNQNDITFRREVTTIFTSRACPFRCIFCHNMFGKKFRGRSVENVLEEMKFLQRELGIRELHVIDDCFNCRPERAMQILTGMMEEGLDYKLAFPNGMRGDRLPDGLLDLMKEAGVYKVNLGIESGDERIQKMIRKGLSLEAIKDGIERTASRGIFTHGFFMLGFPTETEEEMRRTIDFAAASDLHTAGFAILSPFPGTEVSRMAAEAGKEVEFDPDDASYQKVTANLSAVDDATLERMHRTAHWKFYGSPRRAWRIVSTMPKPMDFVKVGLKHFRLKFL